MEIMSYFAQDAQGNIMPSADCYLYAPGTTNLVPGLVDISGSPLSNPFQASNIGKVQFGAPNGVYDLRMKKGARDTTIRIQCADLLQALNETASFLGARATAPTTRADGTPLQLADRYLNTTDQLEYLYKSAGWVVNNVDGQLLATSEGASRIGAIMQDGSIGTVQQAINIGDRSLRQDLKAPAGSDEIGYRSALAEAIGSAISRMVRGRLDDIISSADFLVGGDVNDSAEMQALVDRISSTGGGCIYMPHNKYTMSWIPKRYVSYVGATWGATRNVSGSGAVNRWGTVIVAPDGAPWICDTGVGGALSIGFLGIDFQGKGLSGAGGGLNLRAGTNNPIVRSCGFNNFAEQAIVMNGQIGHFTDLVGTNCLLNRTRTVKSGVFEIRGADNFADNIQGNTGITGIVSSDLFLCGILIGGANNYYHNLEGELSEVGIHIETTGAIHKLVNCRADLNFGHGFSGFGYMAANCHALNNGTAATNTYNGWDIGPRSILTGCTSDSGGTNRVKYGFGFQTGADSAVEGSQPSLNGCRSIGHATAAFDDSLFNGFAHVMFSGWLRGTSLTPDVSGRKTYAAVNSTAAVITGFVGGVKGQELTVYANANVSFQRSADFIISGTKGDGLKQCVAQRAYQFLCVAKASGGSMWVEVGGRDPAVGTTAERPSAYAYPGLIYLDTTLGRPIMRNNAGWIDFSGTSV